MRRGHPRSFARIIPVIDLKQGQVVQAVGGDRKAYLPIRSVLAPDASPANVARALSQTLGAREVYVADLDAIAGGEPAWDDYEQICRYGPRMWLDAGVATARKARRLLEFDMAGRQLNRVIVALESVASPIELTRIVDQVGPKRLAFSLDLMHGRPLTTSDAWSDIPVQHIADLAVSAGLDHLIVLDLARVGTGEGTGTESLCRQLRMKYPELQLVAGGGVRQLEHVYRLVRSGCDAVLIASALHNGRLTAKHLRRFVGGGSALA